MPDTIQFREYSRDGGAGGVGHTTFEGNRNVPNVWWNGAKRKANHNWVENVGNANDWCLLSRYFLCSPGTPGVYFVICRSQPPSIRPISSSFSEMRIYFLLSNAFISQATWKKNLSKSNLTVAFRMYGDFCSLDRKLAATTPSIVSKKRESIFVPKA